VATALTLAELRTAAEVDLGTSGWRAVDQEEVDAFARITGDDQWIHVDTERAASGPYGGTIAHGYLLLALLPVLLRDLLRITDRRFGVNYGINKLRFTAPVPTGSRVRLRGTLAGSEPKGDQILYRLAVELEVEGSERPAFVGEVVYLAF
jgi:acyl dehydratase